jgi:hypothetical protein
VQVKPTSEAAHPINPWPLNQHPALRGREDCTLLRGKSARMTELYFELGEREGKKKAPIYNRR